MPALTLRLQAMPQGGCGRLPAAGTTGRFLPKTVVMAIHYNWIW